LRDINLFSRAEKTVRFIFIISLFLPIVMGCGAWALATGAAPGLAIHNNYLALFGLGIASAAIIAIPLPYIFCWNWQTKYFGACILPLASVSIIGIYPILCIIQYSLLPIIMRLTLILLEFIMAAWWCRRFITLYRLIYSQKKLFNYIYIEEPSAVYYSQKADNAITEKIYKFEQFPRSRCFIIFGTIAFCLTPFATSISQFAGIPFIHIFLAVFATPINLLFLGLCTRGWLIFYFYPKKIKNETNKIVYVDILSRAPKLSTLRK
jgi:hypothetical protein